jgi:hypothetical protein
MAFSAPSSNTESVKVADLNGHLLILEPTEYKTGIQTVHGDADAIEVRINDLDTGHTHDSVLFFNVALKNSLKSKIGQKVLARIGQGTAKPGKSAPWILVDATGDADAVAKANAFIANGSVTANAGGATLSVAAAPAPANINDPAVQALLAQLGAKPVN